MKKSSVITLAAALALPIIAWQFIQNSKLQSTINRLNKTIVEYRDGSVGHAGLSALAPNDHDSTNPDMVGAEDENFDAEFNIGSGGKRGLAEILAERDPMLRMSALIAYVSQLSDAELPGALAKLRESTPEWDPDARVAAQLMLTRWGKADPEGALEYVAGLDPRKAGGDAAIIISALASSDPQAAIKWLADPENKLANMPWVGRILAGSITKEWMRTDPEAALEWAKTLPKDQQTGAYGGVLGTLAATDPARASALATSLPPGEARRDVIGQIARTWSERSPAEAIQWASTLAGEDRQRATSEALGAWAQTNPTDAANYVDQIPESERINGMLDRVASSWARHDAEAAAQWLGQQSEGADKADAMGDVIGSWMEADSIAASAWLLEQPAGNSRDEGIGALARATFDEDPASAITWAANMSNPDKQQWSVGIGVNVWLDRDPEAANQWLESTDALSQTQIQTLLTERSARQARESEADAN